MKLGSPYRHVMLTAWNARWFHLGGDWTKHHIPGLGAASMKRGHTNTHRNKRVAVTLKNGDVIYDRFVVRPKHNRWIELKHTGRIPISAVSTLCDYKGPVECDGRRHVLVVRNADGSTTDVAAGEKHASRTAEE